MANEEQLEILKQVFLLSFILLLPSCIQQKTNVQETTTPHLTSIPIYVSTPTATLQPYEIDIQLDYTIVYESDDFVVREGNINDAEVLADVYHPTGRIKTSVQTFRYYNFLPSIGDESFSKPILDNNGTLFEFEGDFGYMGGNIELIKNNRVVWNGNLQHPIYYPIGAIRFFDDEIAFDYIDVLLDSDNPLPGKVTRSIIYTQGNTAVDVIEALGYKMAFAPFNIKDKLIYIAILNTDEHIIVFDNQEIALGYTFVQNIYSGDAVRFNVYGNGEIIDFYATKGKSWYHVQAGIPEAFIEN